jgi:arylsulfatase A-like enzyme
MRSFVLACCGLFLASSQLLAAERPNIVLIMADDLGFSDLGCYGSEIETPNLDRLASGGLRFNQFYNTAKCHSSRICLLTGLYMFQAGNQKMDKGVTIGEALGGAGYHTMMAGKWHLNSEPTERGFDRYFGHLSGATNFFTGDDTFRLNGDKFDVPAKGFYTTDANTDYAIEFLDEARQTEKPFLLYMAYNAPHYPLHVKEDDFRKYEGRYDLGWDVIRQRRYEKQKSLGILPADVKLSPRPDDVPAWDTLSETDQTWESERMAAYAGMIDSLDQNIGRLVAHLTQHDLIDNTIIMFCSDNGACPFERTRGKEYRPWDPKSYWTYDTGWAHVGNTPFRWYKQNQHEGGITSPMIVSWSGLKTQAGSVTDQPAHLIDFMATCVDLAGAQYPLDHDGRAITPLQGKSLAPIFAGRTRQPHEWLYFQFSNNRAIRKGNMKLASAKGGPWELYDLASDRSELNDLAKESPQQAKELRELWHHVAERIEQAPGNLRRDVGDKKQRTKKKNAAE